MAIDARFFTGNRARLTEVLKGGLVVVSAYKQVQSTGDMAHRFEQESNFWYLCGIEEPEWLLICDGQTNKSWLVEPEIDTTHKIFDGAISELRARETSGVRTVLSHDEGMKLLRTLSRHHSVCYTVDQPKHSEYFNFSLNPAVKENRRMLERIFPTVEPCNRELAELRTIKQPVEITAIKQAVKLTTDAFASVRRELEQFTHEYQIEATFTKAFKWSGYDHAYSPIVATGENACTLHYGKNNSRLKAHQLVLIDIGARVHGYSADITRTYATHSPTQRQQLVHEFVRSAHEQIVDLIKPGVSIDDYQQQVSRIMEGVVEQLKLGSDPRESVRKYFPHAIGHGLGIDTHDSLAGSKVFQPGMVLTVEPGIYIPEERIGVRIEDDILVTPTGHANLSASLSTAL